MPVFEKSLELPLSTVRAFALHESPGILEALTPPWERVTVIQPPRSLAVGTVVILKLKQGPLGLTWRARHTRYEPPHLFEDTQDSGPFAYWRHQHRFQDVPGEPSKCVLTDSVEYEILPGPLKALSFLPDALFVRGKIERMFEYRHQKTLELAQAEAARSQ